MSQLGLAVCDSLVIVTVILLKGMPLILETSYQVYLYPYIYPLMNIAWTISIYLTVILSLERYLGVCWREVAKTFCTIGKTLLYIAIIVVFSSVYNIPRFKEYQLSEILVRTGYDPDLENHDWASGPDWHTNNSWYSKAYSNVTVVQETKLLSNPIYVTVYLTWLNFFVRFIFPTMLLIFFNFKILKEVIFHYFFVLSISH